MKKLKDTAQLPCQDQMILKSSSSIKKTQNESDKQSRKRLFQMNQNEKVQQDIKYIDKQQLQTISKLEQDIYNMGQAKKKMQEMLLKKIDELTQQLDKAKQQIKTQQGKTEIAIQEANKWKKSYQTISYNYDRSQQRIVSYMDLNQKLKDKNRNTIVQFKNKLTSLQKSNHLQQFCTEKQIQSLLQKQKIYEELICSKDNYQGKKLIEYIELCNEKESDIQKILLSMTQKEEFYRNQTETIRKEQEEENNRIVFFTAQCDKIIQNFKSTLKTQDDIAAMVDKLILENESLCKKIVQYRNIEQKVKQSQQKIQVYSSKMEEHISNLKPNSSSKQDIQQFNLYKNSQQQNKKLRLKIKQLQERLQQSNKRSYISREEYDKLQNNLRIHYQKTDQQLLSIKNNQEKFIRLSQNIQKSAANIASSLSQEQIRNAQDHNNYKFQFFEHQKEQSNDSLIIAIQNFQNKSIAALTPLFSSSLSARDNFSDKLPSQGSLLLVFKLAGSFLGVFCSQFNSKNGNSGQLFMFTLGCKKDQTIRTYLKRQGALQNLNRMRFSENSLVIGENQLILKNNSQERVFTLNCRGARLTYFHLDPRKMGIQDQIHENKVKYERLAIYRVYFY